MSNLVFYLLSSVLLLPASAKNHAKRTPQPAPESAAVAASTPAPHVSVSTEAIRQAILAGQQVRGIHLTCWGAGSVKSRNEIIKKISGSVINTVVVAVKETDGKVYIPGVAKAEQLGSHENAIPDPEAMVADFKKAHIYTIARIVTFKDNVLPRKRKDLAVRTPGGDLWRSRNGAVWADQYSHEVWDYNIEVALRAVKAGFDEVQFDYIRYPSEGNTSTCRYSKPHNMNTAMANLGDFLRYARTKIPANVRISADIFGLTTSVKDDMGIGQDIRVLAENADFVYPMMYPSHYAKGEYNLKNPNTEPFKVINRGLRDATEKLGMHYARMRPYLQDFSLFGVHYGPTELRAQLVAAHRNMLQSWVLWNPANHYTWSALTPQSYRTMVDPDYK